MLKLFYLSFNTIVFVHQHTRSHSFMRSLDFSALNFSFLHFSLLAWPLPLSRCVYVRALFYVDYHVSYFISFVVFFSGLLEFICSLANVAAAGGDGVTTAAVQL